MPHYAPMLAKAGVVPADGQGWGCEVKFDGRAIGYVDHELRLFSRNGNNISAAWPELGDPAAVDPPFVVDGEIVSCQVRQSDLCHL